MQHFFIDTDDGDFLHHDDEGYDYPDPEAARRAAIDVLPDMARQKLPDGDRRIFTAQVRSAGGALVYSVTLTLVGEWHVRPEGR